MPHTLTLPRAVIFDWDNTLVSSWEAIAEAINHVRDRYGLPVWTREEIIANCARSARESFPDWFGDRWQGAWAEYYAYFESARDRMGLHPMPGAEAVLAWLLDKQIPSVVVSNKSGDYLRQEALQLGWQKYFRSIVGAADSPRDKPARDHADHALRLAGLTANPETWFIGDSAPDIACARNAGCMPVLVGTPDLAKKLTVDVVVPDCHELLILLKKADRAIG